MIDTNEMRAKGDLPILEEQTVEAEVYTATPDENLAGGRV
jgi:hypothetical protein